MSDDVARAAESNAVWKAAEELSGHFAMRPWIAMARNRNDLRRQVRDHGFDPNEPTKDDCLEASRAMLAIFRQHLLSNQENGRGE